MTCQYCGVKSPRRSHTCPHCGRPLPRRRVHLGRVLAIISAAALGCAALGVASIQRTMPQVSQVVTVLTQKTGSRVYDSQGHLVAQLGNPGRSLTPLSSIDPAMRASLVAIEDHNFYKNSGFDVRSIARAALVDLIHHSAVQGASTITEQLAKNLYLSDQKTLSRKIREFLIGLDLSEHYSKNQILDLYLNTVYFGQGAQGIKEAAHVYFDTTPKKLSWAQATLLAGLLQAPSLDDPLVHPALARKRQAQVVSALERYDHMSRHEGQAILRDPWHLHPQAPQGSGQAYHDAWYIDAVIGQLRDAGFPMSVILNGGLTIHTALHPRVYQIAQRAVDQWMNRNFGTSSRLYPYHQAAVVVENPENGEVWAIIGGRHHFAFLQDDLAIDASRSSGSAIKPLLDYAPALSKGYTAMSVLQDVPIFKGVGGQTWWPQNDDYIYRGYLNLKDALAISDNDIAVHLLYRIGLAYALHFLSTRFGITLPAKEPKTLGLALGVDTNLLALTQGYAAIDNGGVRYAPTFVTSVTDHGRLLFKDRPTPHVAMSPAQAAILTQMMQGVLSPHPIHHIGPAAYPTGYRLGIGRPAAGKSGTSNNEADAWFIGFEPQMVVGVWEGDRLGEIAQPYTNTGEGPAYGAVAAGPIWKEIMQSVNRLNDLPPRPFARPSKLIYLPRVSITSGELPNRYTPPQDIQGAWFVKGTQPTHRGHLWYPLKVAVQPPDTRWSPGCGPFITVAALKPESDWHPGVPKPWDARYWAPKTSCRGKRS